MFTLTQNQEKANQLKVPFNSRIQLLGFLSYAKNYQDIYT